MPRVEVVECETCHRARGEKHIATMKAPCVGTMERWMDNGRCKATDGCIVEPDGVCEHGHQSWLLRLGLI